MRKRIDPVEFRAAMKVLVTAQESGTDKELKDAAQAVHDIESRK
jgi:hypothetical protein